jgi:Zn-dependent protease
VHPFFWVLALLLFVRTPITTLREWLLELAAWTLAIFVSVLVHELGHAFVFRYMFFVESDIMLHGFGGVTVPHSPPRRYYGLKGLLSRIFLDAAGCLAEFILAAIAFGLFCLLPNQNGFNLLSVVKFFLYCTTLISIIWGIFNLLPIYPLDGGQISREIFLFFSPQKGLANSLIISLVTAGICIWMSLTYGMVFVAILLAFLAYQNYIELNHRSFRY